MSLWVDRCVRSGGSGEFRGGECGCAWWVWGGVGLVDFFFFVVGHGGGGCGCDCGYVCGCDGYM